jgi:hypothetical protein
MYKALLLLVCTCSTAIAAEPGPDWAFKPIRHSEHGNGASVDDFLLAKLKERGLSYAPEADRATLIRRLTFDLTGLPPTPEEVDTFVSDKSPMAYERLVDRLLASPHFGERQAVWWLDLVRYADSDGFKADDPRPNAWRYRDYVIRAFNSDKPYDRFVREQLAGDEIAPGDADALIATGYLRHPPDEYNAVNCEQRRQEILNDITDTTASAFLGVTLGCARCHDHKFDPIKQTDYYRIQAFFASWWPVDAPMGTAEERERHEKVRRKWEAETAELRREIAEMEKPFRVSEEKKERQRFPKEYGDIIDIPFEQRTPLQKQIGFMVEKQVYTRSRDVSKSMKGQVKDQWQSMMKRMAEFDRDRPAAEPTAMACTDLGREAPPTHLLKRGDWQKPGENVAAGFLSAIDDREAEFAATTGATTGRRTVLANWIASPRNPLTARVLVNRLWQTHFGRGLVATPSDFGKQGERPTHPELLDWLAQRLIAGGWSIKKIQRLIVLSAAYRQSSIASESALRFDPENRLLSRMPRRRLEGEAIRDALLAISGKLSAHQGGPAVYPELPSEIKASGASWKVSASEEERDRRSVYVAVRRNLRYPLLAVFDAPDGNETCPRRFVTTTAPQALMLLNGKVARDLSSQFAARVSRETGLDNDATVARAYRIALGRSPDDFERRAMRRFLDQAEAARGRREAVADLCHAIVNLNEFLFVD